MRNLFNRKFAVVRTPDDLPKTANTNKAISGVKPSETYHLIRLGDLVKDRISGKQGTAIERHYHLNGCEFVRVETGDDEEKDQNFAIQRLELVECRAEFHRDDESMTGSHLKLGDEVKDVMSGFKGHVIIWVVALFGSHRMIVDPPLKKDGTQADAAFFDECRLELIAAKDPPKVPAAERPAAKEKGCVGGAMKRRTVSSKAPR